MGPSERDAAVALPPILERIRSGVDDVLDRFLAEERSQIAAEHAGFLPLFDEITRLIRAGGKRLRPMFCALGYRAAGGEDLEAVLHAGAAIELFHTFALVHDDVMDQADSRRGAPTIHVRMAEGRRGDDRADAERYGVAAAVLAGDFAMVMADHLFLRADFPPDVLAAAFRRYNRMRVEVAVGQFLDISATSAPVDEREARRIASLKSGGYTVEGPLTVGGILAGASIDVLSVLSRYGAPLGEAFQIRDDIQGALEGRLDLAQAKPTVLLAAARDRAGDDDRRFLDERLGHGDLSDAERDRARGILRATGAIDRAVGLVNDLVAQATDALAATALESGAVEALRALAELIAIRDR